MENLLILSITALLCGAEVQPKLIQTPRQFAVSDLESFNCNNNEIASGSCSAGCALNQCYITTTTSGTTFPQDGFCTVFNVSHAISAGIDWYTVSGRVCMSSSTYPQGTGLLFNYKDQSNYEIVYKTSQDSSTCFVGYLQNGVIQQTGSFDCGSTTANQWHRYTVTVYSNKTFEAALSTQAGYSTIIGTFPTNYPMSTRGGVMIVNDGGTGKVLQFDEITLRLSTDINECASDPCRNGATCYDLNDGYVCACAPGYGGTNCELDLCGNANPVTQITLSESTPSTYVTSPNYPNDYTNNLWLCWIITSESSSRPRLYLQEFAFDLEGATNCSFDYLLVTDSSAGTSWKYCGASAFGTLYTNGSTVGLQFKTDGSITGQGFRIGVDITNGP